MSDNNKNRRVELHSFDQAIIQACQIALAQCIQFENPAELELTSSSINMSIKPEEGVAYVKYNGYKLRVEFTTETIRLITRVHLEDDFTQDVINPHTVEFTVTEDWNLLKIIENLGKESTFLVTQALLQTLETEEAYLAFSEMERFPEVCVRNGMCLMMYRLSERYHHIYGIRIGWCLYPSGARAAKVEILTQLRYAVYRIESNMTLTLIENN